MSPCPLDPATMTTAVPDVLQASDITTWRDASALYLKFSIPDITVTQNPATLACGDQVIVQIDATNSKAADLSTSGTNRFIRYEVVIKDNAFVAGAGGLVKRRVPRIAFGAWNWDQTESTTGTMPTLSALSTAGNRYGFTLTIPLADINNPVGDIGLALAIINDLGHTNTTSLLHEAVGTSFPINMGVTPESDPQLTCGASSVAAATGNWVIPSTWGTGYWNLASGAPTVTLSQTPQFSLSNSIRLGTCNAQWADIAPIASASNWETVQQNTMNHWYLYNPVKPCRMAIWVNAYVSTTAVVKRRFFVMWGRPGISPQDWYVAGLTQPVAVAGPSTPISFIWEKPTAVSFTDHPCLKVYVLPEVLTQTQVDDLLAIDTDAKRVAMEAAYGVSAANMQIAQMNFANIGTGSCTDGVCMQIALRDQLPETRPGKHVSLAGVAFSSGDPGSAAQQVRGDGQTTGRDSLPQRIRIVIQGFGVAAPEPNKPYVYVEPIGSLGWSVPASISTNASLSLNFDVTNPRVVETAFIAGHRVEVLARPRRILFALTTDLPHGVRAPHLDVRALRGFADHLVPVGETRAMHIPVGPRGAIPWLWLILGLLVLLVLAILLRRRRSNP